jgi:hypothetical protein
MPFQDPIGPNHHTSLRYILGDDRVGPDGGTSAHDHLAKDLAARPQVNPVVDNRHVINIQISAPQRDLLPDHHMASQDDPATHHDPLGMREVSGRRQRDSKFTPRKKK